MAKFSDLYSDVETISNVTGQRALVKRALNRALERLSGLAQWPFYLTRGFFTTVATYTTGTADVTNNSTALSGNSTVWTAGMVGRRFRLGATDFYDITARASNTAVTLGQPYQNTTATAQGYTIYQDEYRLPADLSMLQYSKQVQTGLTLIELDPGDMEILFPAGTSTGEPDFIAWIGRRQSDTYSTGTVTATVSGTTITGSSTLWSTGGTPVQGLSRGNRISIGSNIYTIKSVDSDTQLTIYETIVSTVSASAYSIILDNIRVQLYRIPASIRNIWFLYYRKPVILYNDYDEPDLPPEYHWLLIPGALKELWAHKGDEVRTRGAESEFLHGVENMKNAMLSSTRIYRKKPQRVFIFRRGPRYPQEFDVRVSLPY